MRIDEIEINNLLTYDRETITFDNYNVIVGPNASGKTNLIRILNLLSSPSRDGFTEKRLSEELKLNKHEPSLLKTKITLSETETRILLQLLTNKVIDSSLNEELAHIYLLLEWQNVYDNNVPPDFVALYFKKGLIIWNEHSRTYVSHSNKIPKCVGDLIYHQKHNFN